MGGSGHSHLDEFAVLVSFSLSARSIAVTSSCSVSCAVHTLLVVVGEVKSYAEQSRLTVMFKQCQVATLCTCTYFVQQLIPIFADCETVVCSPGGIIPRTCSIVSWLLVRGVTGSSGVWCNFKTFMKARPYLPLPLSSLLRIQWGIIRAHSQK